MTCLLRSRNKQNFLARTQRDTKGHNVCMGSCEKFFRRCPCVIFQCPHIPPILGIEDMESVLTKQYNDKKGA
jgi:hypothetical protein